MLNGVIAVTFVLVGVINLLPLVGVISAPRLQQLYAIELDDPDVALLLRHRAVLLALVGGLLVAAAAAPHLRTAAGMLGLASMLSFIVLALAAPLANAALMRVAWIDVGAALLLMAALGVHLLRARG